MNRLKLDRAYAESDMNAYVVTSLRNLKRYDFENSNLFPKAVDPLKYTTNGVVDAAKKLIYDNILSSEVSAYVKEKQSYEKNMHQVYGIIHNNVDEHVQALITTDQAYIEIQSECDPIRLIRLLRKMCRKEKGVDYAIAAFHSSLTNLLSCCQGSNTAVEFLEDIKVKYDILQSQFGDDFIPASLKTSVMAMDKNASYGSSYDNCTPEQQERINKATRDRLIAYIGVCGYDQKLPGGVTLKKHISGIAAVNKNASVAYPADLADLLKLTTSIMPRPGHGSQNQSQNHNRTSTKPTQTNQRPSDNNKREGAQFAQSGNPETTGSLSLMTEYRDIDDSDLYGEPMFLQTGTITYQGFPTDSEEEYNGCEFGFVNTMTCSQSKRDISAIVNSIATYSLRPSNDPWARTIVSKLRQLDIHTIDDLIIAIPYINDMAAEHNVPRFHRTTLRALTHHTSDLQRPSPELLTLLTDMSQTLPRPQNRDWTHALLYKLGAVGITKIEGLTRALPYLNQLLVEHSFPQLNRTTISAIAQCLQHNPEQAGESGEVSAHTIETGEVHTQSTERGIVSTSLCRPSGKFGEVSSPFSSETDLNETISPSSQQNNTNTFTYSEAVHTLLAHFRPSGRVINQQWILLDSGSTVNLFSNGKLLNNIRNAPYGGHITINTSGGSVITKQQGDLPGFGTVWYHPDDIANVLSLSHVSINFRITMDTAIDNAIIVHKSDGSTRRFGLSDTGLYVTDVRDQSGSLLTIAMVKDQSMKYSALDMRRAKAARRLQTTIGHPTTKQLIKIVESNLLDGCGTHRKDIMIAEQVFGPNKAGLKGKTTTHQTEHLREELTPLPHFIMENYKSVTLCVDILYVNGIPFVTSLSRHIYFTTVEAIHNAKAHTLARCISSIISQYKKRGLSVLNVIADNQFDCVAEHLANLNPPVEYMQLAKDEHEKFIERNNRFVKERCQCIFADMPYKRIPKRMTIRMVYTAVFWINSFPRQEGVSDTMSPRLLLTGVKPSILHAKYKFGEYFQTHERSKNDMTERTLDAVCAPDRSEMHKGDSTQST